jgi:hypothetical protein
LLSSSSKDSDPPAGSLLSLIISQGNGSSVY